MKVNRIFALTFAMLLSIGSVFAQEDFNKAQKAPQNKEVVLVKESRTRGGYDNIQVAYKSALREAKQTNHKKDIGIRNLAKGDLKVESDGSVSYYYTYTVVELSSAVEHKMYEAIGRATREIEEGYRFAIYKLSFAESVYDKESIQSQIVDCLIRKGYKVLAKKVTETL